MDERDYYLPNMERQARTDQVCAVLDRLNTRNVKDVWSEKYPTHVIYLACLPGVLSDGELQQLATRAALLAVVQLPVSNERTEMLHLLNRMNAAKCAEDHAFVSKEVARIKAEVGSVRSVVSGQYEPAKCAALAVWYAAMPGGTSLNAGQCASLAVYFAGWSTSDPEGASADTSVTPSTTHLCISILLGGK